MEIATTNRQEMEPMVVFTQKKQERFNNKLYAELEPRTEKILNKLKKRLDAVEEQMTTENIKKSSKKIQQWIDRHSSDRVQVKKKSLHLFTGGLEPAQMSKGISNIRNRLREGFYATLPPSNELKGRVSKPNDS